MTEFVAGQRWLSETETELGLGIIQAVDHRLITVHFPGSDEVRTYARNNNPLSRFSHKVGDTLTAVTGDTAYVHAVEDAGGVLIYDVSSTADDPAHFSLPESLLAAEITLSHPGDRLFSRQIDKHAWFELRHAALSAQERSQSSPMLGFVGPRIDFVPHQFYIAHEVAKRFAPRVLLADEVGLGKTIEAGLIVHHQLLAGLSRRILIIVPKALVNQWFVEMFRRFNMHFHMFDEERLQALAGEIENPFLAEQLVLIDTDFLVRTDITQLANASWDLVIVDEAHHLHWTPGSASEAYCRVETIARHCQGLLLLTATPEQLGVESHFARLRLLDPQRFHSLEQFIVEQNDYVAIADLLREAHATPEWSTSLKQRIAEKLQHDISNQTDNDALLHALLDRNGTGRVQFRNTRKNVRGFPRRHCHPVELSAAVENEISTTSTASPLLVWLTQWLRDHRREKVLIICQAKETAIELHTWLQYHQGMSVAVFHEDLDIISRDRAAAWFADMDEGAQALVCSEIGSEGRNFQFAHHLVLFDLPANPDLLEQRIGRLDRIGQKNDVEIWVPHIAHSEQAVLFRWYHDGMNAFEHTNPAGTMILGTVEPYLQQALENPEDGRSLQTLIAVTREACNHALKKLEDGRDVILELQSFDAGKAEALRQDVDLATSTSPHAFLDAVFERFGVDVEEQASGNVILRPGDHMRVDHFPGLPEDGLTATFDRAMALAREDIQFLTWEHPLTRGAIDLVLASDKGKASVCLLKSRSVRPGTVLIELLYVLKCVAPPHLQAHRYLPPRLLRSLIDLNGKDIAASVAHEALNRLCHPIDKTVGKRIIESQQETLSQLIDAHQAAMREQSRHAIEVAIKTMRELQQSEIDRMRELARRNPNIRTGEIRFLEEQTTLLELELARSTCQLDAIRVIVAAE